MSKYSDSSIADCINCDAPLGLSNVMERPRKVAGTVKVRVKCDVCESTYVLRFTPSQWAWVTDIVGGSDRRSAERIGRKVAEFRKVDLAVVETVDDIVPFWHHSPFDEKLRTEGVSL